MLKKSLLLLKCHSQDDFGEFSPSASNLDLSLFEILLLSEHKKETFGREIAKEGRNKVKSQSSAQCGISVAQCGISVAQCAGSVELWKPVQVCHLIIGHAVASLMR